MSFSQRFLLPILPGFLKNPKGKDHSLVIKKSLALVALKVTGKPWLSQAFQNELPILSLNRGEKVHQLTLSWRRPLSYRNQSIDLQSNSSWKKWSSQSYRKQTDPFRCPLNYILDFLACLYEEGYECRTINCYRTAITGFQEKIEGLPVGRHPEVCTLLTGCIFIHLGCSDCSRIYKRQLHRQ